MKEFQICNEFIISDDKLINPKRVKKPEDIGSYELIGVYKGSQIKKISKTVSEGNYYYLETIREIKSEDQTSIELENGPYCHSNDKIDCFAFCIQKETNSKIIIKKEGKSYIDVVIEGKVKVDNFELENGRFRLKFKIFNKSSKAREVVAPINTLKALYDSKHVEMLNEIDEFVENFS